MQSKNFNRRDFVKSAALFGTGLLLPKTSFGFEKGDIIGHGTHKYKVIPDWCKASQDINPVKDCHEFGMDKKKRIILLTNDTRNNVIIFDKSGKVLDSWGKEYPGAHGLTLSNEGGEEFLYITDHDLHKVFKTTLNGKVLLTLDYPKESGKYDTADKYKPTETAIAPNGDIFIADGYGEQYILQYNSKGEFIKSFGGRGTGDEQFQNAHGVTLDSRDKKNPILLITERQGNTLKRFSLDGKLISMISLPGAYFCRPVVKGENVYFAVLVSKMPWDSQSGFVMILDKNNKVISNPGGSEPIYIDGKLQPMSQVGHEFMHPHDVLVDDDENLYIAQWNSKRTYPIKLERV